MESTMKMFEDEAVKWDAMLADGASWQNHQESFRRFHWFLKRALKIGNRTKSYRLLDLGSGTGEAAWPLWKRVASVTFMDRSQAMLRLARNKYPKGIFVKGNAEKPPFLDAEFDVIVSRGGVISMMEAPSRVGAMLEGCHRIMRKGGFLLFDFVTKTDDEALPKGMYEQAFSRTEMEALIRKHMPCAAILAYDGTEAHAFNRILIKKTV